MQQSTNLNMQQIVEDNMLVVCDEATNLEGLLKDAVRGSVTFAGNKFTGKTEQDLQRFLTTQFGAENTKEIGRWHNQALMGLSQQFLQANTLATNDTYAKTHDYDANYFLEGSELKYSCVASKVAVEDYNNIWSGKAKSISIPGKIKSDMVLVPDKGFKLTRLTSNSQLLIKLIEQEKTPLTETELNQNKAEVLSPSTQIAIQQLIMSANKLPSVKMKIMALEVADELGRRANTQNPKKLKTITSVALQTRLMLTTPEGTDFSSYNKLAMQASKTIGTSETFKSVRTMFNRANPLQRKMQNLATLQQQTLDHEKSLTAKNQSNDGFNFRR